MSNLVTTGTAFTELTALEVAALSILEKMYGCTVYVNPVGYEPGFYTQLTLGVWSKRAYLAVDQHRNILVDVTGDRDEVMHTFDR